MLDWSRLEGLMAQFWAILSDPDREEVRTMFREAAQIDAILAQLLRTGILITEGETEPIYKLKS